MSTKSSTSMKKKTSTKNTNKITTNRTSLRSIKSKDDKMLEKVERYVDKKREKTSQEIIERKSKRPAKKYQEWELELMISRVSVESKPKDKVKETSKQILYIIYAIIFLVVLIFIIKYFFIWNIPQIS